MIEERKEEDWRREMGMREIEVRTLAQFSVAPPSAANIAVAQTIALLPPDAKPKRQPLRYVPAEQVNALFGPSGGGH